MMRKREHSCSWLLLPLVILVLLGFVSAVGNMDERAGIEGKQRLEEDAPQNGSGLLCRGGQIPPSVAYMEEHYGVQYDKERYLVAYDAFAIEPDARHHGIWSESMKRNKGNISGLMALLLLCVFAICVVLVLLTGTEVYSGLVGGIRPAMTARCRCGI